MNIIYNNHIFMIKIILELKRTLKKSKLLFLEKNFDYQITNVENRPLTR